MVRTNQTTTIVKYQAIRPQPQCRFYTPGQGPIYQTHPALVLSLKCVRLVSHDFFQAECKTKEAL